MPKFPDRFFKQAVFSLILAAWAGLLFKYFHWNGSGTILIISLCSLAFLFGIKASHSEEENIATKVLYVSFSIFALGFLFLIQHWEGAQMMLKINGITFAASLILYYVKRGKNRK